jgi:hypothetical protein
MTESFREDYSFVRIKNMEQNVIIGAIPWPVAAAAAVWFGVMAYKAQKNCVLWAIGGGLMALVLTTLVLGLGQAAFIPYTSEEQALFRMKLAGLALLIVLCVGWWFTGSLHPQLLAPWKQFKDSSKETHGETGGASPAKPPATTPKP